MNKQEKIEYALDYARVLLYSVGLISWSVGTNKSCSTVAIMDHDKKTISYSDRFITISDKDDFRRATMHEATHALLGYGKGHGKEFAELCTRLYPDEPFSGSCVDAPIQRYRIACPNCLHFALANKKDEGYCSFCAEKGLGLFRLHNSPNTLDVTVWASK